MKTEKEKEEDEKLMKKAKCDSRQAIYISLADHRSFTFQSCCSICESLSAVKVA